MESEKIKEKVKERIKTKEDLRLFEQYFNIFLTVSFGRVECEKPSLACEMAIDYALEAMETIKEVKKSITS